MGCDSRFSIRAKSSTNPGGRNLGLGIQIGDLENNFRTLQSGLYRALLQGDSSYDV